MLISCVSDLHLEFGNDPTPIFNTKCDVLVIAGDLHVGSENTIESLCYINENHHYNPCIIFVPGNHEYYHYGKHQVDKKFESFHISEYAIKNNIYILNNTSVMLQNVLFLGGTGWWDESNGKITLQQIFGLNDFRLISDIQENHNGVLWGIESRQFFETKLSQFYDNIEKIVCISHNGPTKKVHRKYQGSQLNTCFCNDWKDLIEEYQPNYWIYGHTHEYMEYSIDKTKVICNPMGYPRENNFFNPNLVIEV